MKINYDLKLKEELEKIGYDADIVSKQSKADIS